MTAYTPVVTPAVTPAYHHDQPPLTIELIRQYFCQHPVGKLIDTSVRKLARDIGRSPGEITKHLRQLAADGWIEVLACQHGTLIEVLRSLMSDHGHVHPPEPPTERSCQPDAESGVKAHDRFAAENVVSRPMIAEEYKELHDSCMQQQHARAIGEGLKEQPANTFPVVAIEVWHAMATGTPGYTRERCDADFKKLIDRGYDAPNAVAVLINAVINGQPIYSSSQMATRANGYRKAVAPEPSTAPAAPAQEHRHEATQPRRSRPVDRTPEQPALAAGALNAIPYCEIPDDL